MGFYRKPLEEVVPANAEIIYRAPDLYHTTATDSPNSSVSVRQQNGQLTYVPTAEFALTSSNVFTGDQIINADLYVNGTINVSSLISASIIYESGSTVFGNSMDDYHQFTGSIYITGSTTQIGNVVTIGDTTMTGSLNITGSTNQIGNIALIGNEVITGSIDTTGNVNTETDYYINGNRQQNHGQFSTLHTLSGSAMTASIIPYDSTDLVYGMYLSGSSKIVIEHTGVYNFVFSAVGTTIVNENTTFAIWFRKNGQDIPNSATIKDIYKVSGGLGRVVMAVSAMFELNVGDYVELWWMPYTVSTQLQYLPANNIPAVPSMILTVFQVR